MHLGYNNNGENGWTNIGVKVNVAILASLQFSLCPNGLGWEGASVYFHYVIPHTIVAHNTTCVITLSLLGESYVG